jgi:sulfur carrier protein
MIEFRLNNRDEQLPADTISVAGLLKIKNYTFRMLVVKINGRLVQKEAYDSVFIKNDDDVHVIHLISGG